MPDDMLEDAIAISKKTLDEHDFETDGVEVRLGALTYSDCEESQEVHGREMGAVLARVPGQVIRLPLGPREEPLRVLHVRAEQDLLPDLQGLVNASARALYSLVSATLYI